MRMEEQTSPVQADPEAIACPTTGEVDDSGENGPANGVDLDQGEDGGSTVAGATFNLTNSIIGAGAIGLGGAIAVSGGLISVFLVLLFGLLTKLSLDLVIRLSVETEGANGSYEDLAQLRLGHAGRILVLVCKFFYAFGCLVAYVVVIKDNFAPALSNLLYGRATSHHDWFQELLTHENWFTWIVCLIFILPLCLLRDMTPLSSFSMVGVVAMFSIVGIVIYMYFFCPDIGHSGGSFYTHWLEIRPGVFESLGTFVFTFVSQHTVHLVFGSLKPQLRTVSKWKTVSSLSLLNATAVSLSVGVFVYMTFWEETESDIFQIYPQGWMIDLAKLLLCITMVLTFPLPFFTCRELLIVSIVHPLCSLQGIDDSTRNEGTADSENDLQRPLLPASESSGNISWTSAELVESITAVATPRNWLLPDDDRQLQLPGHVALTVKLWFVTICLAIAAPNLGDVLDLVGCATGTVIAFLLPALLSFQLDGCNTLAVVLFTVGFAVGTLGTYFSIAKLYEDLKL